MEVKLKEIARISIPLIGPRGGSIPISLNKLKPPFNPRAVRQTPPWAIYKRCSMHYEKHIKYAYESNITPPQFNETRYVRIMRIIQGHGRVMDDDNFRGGMKPLIDVLKRRGYIYDDNPKNVRIKYYQDNVLKPKLHSLIIYIYIDENYQRITQESVLDVSMF